MGRRLTLAWVLLALATPAAHAQLAPYSETVNPDGSKHLRFAYGPILAAPGQNLILFGPQSIAAPPEDGYITAFTPNLIRADGKPPPVDELHMHHAVFLNMSRRDATVPSLPGERMFAFAEEKTIGRLPAPYGYPYKASDALAINYMLHNGRPTTDAVWITYELDFVPEASPLARTMRPARPVWMDVVNGSAYPVFDVRRGDGGADGRYTYPDDAPRDPYAGGPKRNEWTVDRDGSILQTAGHVHPGGLWTDLDVIRRGRTSRLFRSEAKYFDPNGPVSWDMAMTAPNRDYKVAVNKGDKLRVSATYETKLASWYESMGIMVAFMADDQTGALDPFAEDYRAPTGMPTHGQLPEATHYGGGSTVGAPDLSRLPDGETVDSRVGIANFAYVPGDQFAPMTSPNPPAVKPGQSLTFGNLDAAGSILHTVTACKFPCSGETGVSYPLADGKVDFDSGQLGYGPTGLTAAANRAEWRTPKDMKPGTYTYFCRVHPYMRGSFRVAGSPEAEPTPERRRARMRLSTRAVRVRKGRARVPVACAAGAEPCAGTLSLWWRGRKVGQAAYRVAAAGRAVVAVRLDTRARKALRRAGRLPVRVVASGEGPASASRTWLRG